MEDVQSLTPDQAQAAIRQLPLDASMMAALRDPAHPGHAAANAHRRDLYSAAYAGSDAKDAEERASGAFPDEAHSPLDDSSHFAPPARPEDYRFDVLPDALQHDAALESKARGWFHRAGLPTWLARNIVAEWNRLAADPPTEAANESTAVATEHALRDAWGGAYDARISAARALLADLNEPELLTLLDRSGLANSEYLIRQLAAFAAHRQRA